MGPRCSGGDIIWSRHCSENRSKTSALRVLLKDGLSKGSRERRRAGGLPTSLRRLRSVHVTAMRP